MMKSLGIVAVLSLVAAPAFAQGVPAPINAPAAVTSGHALCGTANRQQAADCGVVPGTVTGVTASSPLSSSGGTAPNIAIASPLPAANGGTGVSNGSTLTLGGAVVFSGANPVTFATSGAVNLTLPAVTDTAAVLGTAQTFTATPTFSNATLSAIFAGGTIAIGTASPCAGAGKILIHLGTNENWGINTSIAGVSGPSLYSANDLCTVFEPFAISGAPLVLNPTNGAMVGIGTTNPKATLDVNGGVRAAITTVSALPSCGAANEGERRGVSDATATTFLSTVAGGGTYHAPVYCNNTNWVIGG